MGLDLVLRGGRVIDPSQGIHAVMDVGFEAGRVARVGNDLAGADLKDVSGCIVTPGLIDLHTHVYWGGTSLGVDPARLMRGGCTTVVDTGSAGPGNYAGFLSHVIKPSPVRILAFLNVSFAGIYGFSRRVMVGEGGDLGLMAPIDAVEVARDHPDATSRGSRGPSTTWISTGEHLTGNQRLVATGVVIRGRWRNGCSSRLPLEEEGARNE